MKEIEEYTPASKNTHCFEGQAGDAETLFPGTFVLRVWGALFLMLWAVKNKIKG